MKAPLPFALLVVVAPALAAQSRASRLIDSAFAQAHAGRLDSAAALLGPVLDASIPSKPEEHASALVVYGVVEFFRGRDSAAARAFHEALEIRIDLRGDWMFQTDSSLGQLWRRERRRAICGTADLAAYDFLKSDKLAGPESTFNRIKMPRILSGPRLSYPEYLRRARVQGRVVVAAVVDTAGQVEPGSIKIVQSPHRDFSDQGKHYVEKARFEPARIDGHPVRACVEVPVDFKLRQ